MVVPRIALIATVALLATAGSANAAFPGANGRIAYTDGYTQVVTMAPDGSDARSLTSGSYDNSPVWSPDGRRIAFSSSFGTGPFAIYTMNADGSDRRRITFSRGDEFSPAWSPDGHHLVFTRIVDDSTCDGFLYCGEEIFTINADGSEERRLTFNTTFDNSPVWSPDGAKIALSRYERGSCVNFQCDYDIFTMNPDGSDEVNLTHNDEANHGPDWSPDGSQIAFSSTKNACCVGEIYKMNADGSDMKQLTFQSPSRGDWIISGSPAW